MKNVVLIFTIFCLGLSLSAQDKCEFKLSLRDGNIISGTSSNLNKVVLNTEYGKLEIPIKNVSSIELGLPKSASVTAKVNTLVKMLNNENENSRKGAYDEIIKLGVEAIPALNEIIYSEKYEAPVYGDYTAEGAIKEIQSINNLSDNLTDKDIVNIDYQYVMGGNIDFSGMKLTTAYGVLDIPRSKIERIDVLYTATGEGGDKVFKLMASKHISSNSNGGWLKTGIVLKAGQQFSITATGEIVLASLSNGKYTPKGSANASTEGDDYGYGSNYPVYGNVVFKIGENGNVMKAGANFYGAAPATGMLYLSIYETVYNSANTGSYTVKVKL